jgi:hypothetical protein
MIDLGLVPSFLELAYQHKDYLEFFEVLLSLLEVDMDVIPLNAQFLSLLESQNFSSGMDVETLISFVAKNADLQLLIESNLLQTIFTLDSTQDLLISLVNYCVANKKSDLLEHLVSVGLTPFLNEKKIALRKIET